MILAKDNEMEAYKIRRISIHYCLIYLVLNPRLITFN